jgi:hypothetical protein
LAGESFVRLVPGVSDWPAHDKAGHTTVQEAARALRHLLNEGSPEIFETEAPVEYAGILENSGGRD